MSAAAAAPESVLPYPPIKKDAQFVVLSDWVCPDLLFPAFSFSGWRCKTGIDDWYGRMERSLTRTVTIFWLTILVSGSTSGQSSFFTFEALPEQERGKADMDKLKIDERTTLKSLMAEFLSETLSGKCSSLSRCRSRSARRSLWRVGLLLLFIIICNS